MRPRTAQGGSGVGVAATILYLVEVNRANGNLDAADVGAWLWGIGSLLCVIGGRERIRDKKVGRRKKWGLVAWPMVVLSLGISLTIAFNWAAAGKGSLTDHLIAIVPSATLLGIDGHHVVVEVHVSSGLPSFAVVGLPDTACRRDWQLRSP